MFCGFVKKNNYLYKFGCENKLLRINFLLEDCEILLYKINFDL